MEGLTIDTSMPAPPSHPAFSATMDEVQAPSTSNTVPLADVNVLKFTRQCLGKGTFGKVMKAAYGDLGFVAVKLMDGQGQEKALEKEIMYLHTYGGGSEHIVRFYGYITRPVLGYVMEYMDCGSLDGLLKRRSIAYTIDHVMSWLRQIASACAYMHSISLVHRDLKPHNLLLSNRYLVIKICDFGTVGSLRQSMTNCRGSAPWMAPEVFQSKNYSTSCDVFSLGIILWQMIARRKPYPEVNPYTLLWNVSTGKRPPVIKCDPLLWSLITRMWAKETSFRPAMNQIEQFASIMMKVYNRYNEPLEDTSFLGDARSPQPTPLFGSHRLSTGGTTTPRGNGVPMGHRRGGSHDTVLINTDSASPSSSGISTPRAALIPQSSSSSSSMRAVRSQSFAYPRPNGGGGNVANGVPGGGGHTPAEASLDNDDDIFSSLDNHLKPIQPLWGDTESEEKYNMHAAFAYPLSESNVRIAQLTKEKHRLIAQINDSIELSKLLKRKTFLEKTILDCFAKVESKGFCKQKARSPTGN